MPPAARLLQDPPGFFDKDSYASFLISVAAIVFITYLVIQQRLFRFCKKITTPAPRMPVPKYAKGLRFDPEKHGSKNVY
jgi:hypothetical protein